MKKEDQNMREQYINEIYEKFFDAKALSKPNIVAEDNDKYRHRIDYVEAIKKTEENIKKHIRNSLTNNNESYEIYKNGDKVGIPHFIKMIQNTPLGMRILLEYCRVFIYSNICQLEFTDEELQNMGGGHIKKALEEVKAFSQLKLSDIPKLLKNQWNEIDKARDVFTRNCHVTKKQEGFDEAMDSETQSIESYKKETSYNRSLFGINLQFKYLVVELSHILDGKFTHEQDCLSTSTTARFTKIVFDIYRQICDIPKSYLQTYIKKRSLNDYFKTTLVQGVFNAPEHTSATEDGGCTLGDIHLAEIWEEMFITSSHNTEVIKVTIPNFLNN